MENKLVMQYRLALTAYRDATSKFVAVRLLQHWDGLRRPDDQSPSTGYSVVCSRPEQTVLWVIYMWAMSSGGPEGSKNFNIAHRAYLH